MLLNYAICTKGSVILRTEAQKRADKKYKEKTYKTLSVNAKISEYEKIEKYCNDNNISKNKLLLSATAYIIDNNIKL